MKDGIIFICTNCKVKLEAPKHSEGKNGKCPKCGERVFVPAATVSEPEEKENQ